MTYISLAYDDTRDDVHTYQTDTNEQIDEAKAAMRELCMVAAPVYRTSAADLDEAETLGFPDSERTGQVLFA